MYHKIRFTLVTFLFFTVSILAQEKGVSPVQTIRGIVTDGASGHPMPYVTVAVTDLPGVGTTTADDGTFSIDRIPVGRHTVQASFVGYESGIFREVLVTSSKEVYLEISLKENIQELEEVVVRAQVNKEQPLNKMATTGARMLSVEEASRYAGGMDDPARLVSSFAGVSPSVSNNGISIHGNAPHLLQWKLEDVEIPNPNHFADLSTLGGGILSSLSSHVLGNSDFFTGAFPAEYSNAVSGVFDMKLRNGNSQKFENTFQVGVLGIDIASEGPLSRNHRASYIFNYRYSTLALMNKLDKGADIGGVLDYQDLNFKFNFPTLKAGTFIVWGTGLIDSFEDEFEDDPAEWENPRDNFAATAKQHMAAGGLSHRFFFRNNSFLKTTVAVTDFKHTGVEDSHDWDMNRSPYLDLNRRNTNIVFTSSYNQKFGARHTNKTGFTYTRMIYDMNLDRAPFESLPLETLSHGDGQTDLISAYTSSSIGISNNIMLNIGLNAQMLTLNNSWMLEPRAGIKWQAGARTSLALAYGLHSRMEKMDVFFVRTQTTGTEPVNEDLDFTKAHHLMFSYAYRISDWMNLRIEPYFQYLYDVPVIADSSFSVLNRSDFYVENALVNDGKGRNIGIDLTLERYLKQGLYYMLTGSVFDSRYRGGDGVWYDTRYNRRFIVNALVGKEWMIGRNRQNMLSANVKFTYQGGDRYSPVDETATLNHPDKETQYDETKAFSKQFPPMFLANITLSYQINRKKMSHEFAVKFLNLTRTNEYYGYHYNFKTMVIERNERATPITNVSYKIEF